ncbi:MULTISPECIES: SDR family oxidoreductase [Paenibacillus]|uniref:SDR family oxidoreductase n=1 Tax=Paenibacillus TaxID=44249 RepID=UPI000B838213|nr:MULTISPECIES: SDR family oxidoreductase [Paenibacillus]MBD8840577.1 SDR family oxidoreductase [Paenibacillus sp. CFBP 13594]PRA03480.1 3-oxoacyl-ACP reductase [Paenibacillus sp. MYb63]PRA46898.1 3-oxoacyl-ACP reductase [Paenibacillus sp. MYb67]QZN76653.1 SDR family oxidoreductase [Paenibacillus sp. DR312]
MDMGLQGKKALVLASSRGLGKAVAAQLAAEGADVMLASRSEEKLAAVKQELLALGGGGRVEYCATDVTRKEDIEALIGKTAELFGQIDILVNNSGGPPSGSFESLTDEDWERAFELNVLSYVRLIRGALPYMKERGGHIVNIASTSVKQPIPGLVLSNTFRTGVFGLAKTLSQELAPYGILINTVAPGRIATDRIRELDAARAEQNGISEEEVSDQFRKEIPLGRYGQPEEFAKAVVFLLSGANTYITGTSLIVDGGMVRAL